MSDLIGQTISHYKILEKLGEGGMGIVYKATDRRLFRHVAVKILPPQFVTSDKKGLRFIQEARAASALNHPNICTIYDIGKHEDIEFIVMEFIEGDTLRKIMIERQCLSEKEVVNIGSQVCDALTAAHEKGIIHRDLKPENLMITRQNRVKVMDFGLAKLLHGEHDSLEASTLKENYLASQDLLKTNLSTFQGTAYYMAPEQIEKKRVDARTDIFAVGVVLYELLTGLPPFAGRDSVAVMKSILKDNPKPVSDTVPDISPEVETAVLKALAKRPGERPQNTSILKDQLLRSQAINSKDLVQRRSFRWPIMLSTLGLILLVTTVMFFNSRRPTDNNRKAISSLTELHPIGSLSAVERWPSFSPSGKQVVYTSKELGEENVVAQLWTKNLMNGKNSRMSFPAGMESSVDVEMPNWSPDGQWFAFARNGIWLADTMGQNVRQLTDFGTCPKWSADGKQIAFSTNYFAGHGGAIYVYDIVDSAYRQLSPENGRNFSQPDWSPDGDWLVCLSAIEMQGAVWLIEVKTGKADLLTEFGSYIQNPVWSPNQNVIYFSSEKSRFMDLWRAEVDLARRELTGEPVQITSGFSTDFLDLSPSGDRFIFSVIKSEPQVWHVPSFGMSSDIRRIMLADQGGIGAIDISPDGSRIVFVDGYGQLHISSLKENRVSDIYRDIAYYPTWSPDGRWIMFGDAADIWRIPASGGQAEKLIAHPGADLRPSYSPDGKSLCYVSNRSGAAALWIENLETRQARQITDRPGDFSRGGGHTQATRSPISGILGQMRHPVFMYTISELPPVKKFSVLIIVRSMGRCMAGSAGDLMTRRCISVTKAS
jgi:serine/threonine protein kinase